MLSNEQINTLWPQIKVGLRNIWAKLENEELDQAKGDFSSIAEIVEDKYSEDRGEIKSKLENLLASFDNDTDKGIDPDVSSYHRRPFNEDWNPRH